MLYDGLMWSTGNNLYGALGLGNETNFNTPQLIPEIPPVQSISCGGYYTIAITNDDNLWSFGYNIFGQLCLGNKSKGRSKKL